MNLKNLSNAVTSKAGLQILKTRKHSPKILFVAGAIGFVATVILASRATMKLHDVLDDHEAEVEGAKKIAELEQYSEAEHKKDLVQIHVKTAFDVAKLYALPVIVGVASIAALTGAHIVLDRRLAGVTAAYAAMDKGFKEYRKRVEDRFGKDVDNEMRHGVEYREVVEETETGPVVKVVKHAKLGEPSIYAKWFDQASRNWQPQPEYNIMFLKAQQVFLNQKLQTQGWVFLSDVYDALDIPQNGSPFCRVTGWIKDADKNGTGDGYINFVDAIVNGNTQSARDFWNGVNKAVLLDFNVDGIIWDKI